MAAGLTLDTGALVALERRRLGITRVIRAAVLAQDRVTVPSPVIVEWWRGGPRQRRFQNLFRAKGIVVEPTSFEVAKLAGEAIAKTGATAVDAIVMAGAAQRGDIVFTSDIEDLDLLRTVFPSVRLFGVH